MDWGFLYILILSFVVIFGDFQLRFYAQTNNLTNLGWGVLGYGGVVYFLIQSLRFGNVLNVNALWYGMSGLIGSIAAYYFLGDRLAEFHQYIGVAFIITGIILIKA
jgi:hypothetical protein